MKRGLIVDSNDVRQLQAYVSAIRSIMDTINQANTEKSRLIREAYAAGFQRRAFKDLIQYLDTDRFHLDDVPELYNRLVEHRRFLRNEDQGNGEPRDNSE